MPPEYLSSVLLAASASPNSSSSSAALLLASDLLRPSSSAKIRQVLGCGQPLIDRGALARQADELTDDLGLVHHVVAEHLGAPAVRLEKRGQHVDDGRLAGAVRPEQGIDAAARYRQVYAVNGAVVPEDLDEPVGFDGKGALLDYLSSRPGFLIRCIIMDRSLIAARR